MEKLGMESCQSWDLAFDRLHVHCYVFGFTFFLSYSFQASETTVWWPQRRPLQRALNHLDSDTWSSRHEAKVSILQQQVPKKRIFVTVKLRMSGLQCWPACLPWARWQCISKHDLHVMGLVGGKRSRFSAELIGDFRLEVTDLKLHTWRMGPCECLAASLHKALIACQIHWAKSPVLLATSRCLMPGNGFIF